MELKQLGKYKILARIGRGAMGEVYRAYDPVLNREVAVKTMSSDVGADPELRKRFEREAQSAARLNHPNVTTVYDYGEEQGQVYIAMELLEGSDLKELIKKQTQLALPEKLGLMEQMAEGLAFAHSKGVVHRDLKPANIHVQRGGQVKIMDFGLARFATSDMTRAGAILGTPNYMSPEQVRGEKATAQSDVFSLGAVFYELLTYRKAFTGETLHGVLFQVVQASPEPLPQVLPGLPATLSQTVERALAKDAAKRFRDAGELRDALRAVRADMGGLAPATRKAVDAGRHAEHVQTFDADTSTLAETVGPTLARPPEPSSSDPTRILASSITETVRPPPRIVSAPTYAPKSTPSITPQPPARPVSYGLGLTAAAAVVVLAGVYLWWRSQPRETPVATTSVSPAVVDREAPAPPPPEHAGFAPALEEARRLLDEKDYRTAAARADSVLAKDGENQEARDVLSKARARIRQSDQAASELKKALDVGDVDQASAGLARLVELDPRHPEVPGLTIRLNSALKGRAEAARQALERSRREPPPSPEPQGSGVAGAARPVAPVAKGQEPSPTQATPPPTAQPPVPAPAPPTPATQPLPSPTVPAAPPQTEAQVRQAIQGALEAYRAAFESLSADALRAIHPTLDYEAMKARFASVTAYDVKIKVQSIALHGETATAACLVTYTPKPKPAGKIPPVPTVFHLKRSGAVWIIDRVSRS